MKSPSKRSQRVAELIQRKLAQLIQKECKDPRLPSWITISAVEISSDFSYAKVYFTVLNADPKETLLVLNSVSSFLRAQLAKTLTIRTVPQLQFIYDESLVYGQKMQAIINQADVGDDHSEE